jgi:hypothetical protein
MLTKACRFKIGTGATNLDGPGSSCFREIDPNGVPFALSDHREGKRISHHGRIRDISGLKILTAAPQN